MTSEEEGAMVVVDDDELELELARRCYRSTEHTMPLRAMSSGAELLRYLEEVRSGSEPEPCAILVDLSMPEMSGFELIESCRLDPALKHLRFVVLTNSAWPADRARAEQLGAAFHTKPSTPRELVALFESL